jgi:hypothetical protein
MATEKLSVNDFKQCEMRVTGNMRPDSKDQYLFAKFLKCMQHVYLAEDGPRLLSKRKFSPKKQTQQIKIDP